MFNKINDAIKTAMKNKDAMRLSVLRMMKSKVLYVNARGDLPDNEIIKILTKYGKEVKESSEEFNKVGRTDDAAKAEKELVIVKEFLPKELSADEIKSLVEATIKEVGASSIKDMGKVMKAVREKAPASDGKTVSQLVKDLLK